MGGHAREPNGTTADPSGGAAGHGRLPPRPTDLAPERAPTQPPSRPDLAAAASGSRGPADVPRPVLASPGGALTLQQGAGNAAVTRLVAGSSRDGSGPAGSAGAGAAASSERPASVASASAPAASGASANPASPAASALPASVGAPGGAGSGGADAETAPAMDLGMLSDAPPLIVTTAQAIQQQAERHRADLTAAVAASQAQSDAEATATGAGIDARANAEIAALAGRIEQRKGEVRAHVTGATSQIGAALGQRSGQARASGSAARRALTAATTAAKSSARTASGDQAGRAQQEGTAEADRAVNTSTELEGTVQAAAQQAASAGANPDEREAASTAVHGTAGDLTADMRKKSASLASEVRKSSGELASTIRKAGTELAGKLGEDEAQLGTQLDQSAQTTAQQISGLGSSQVAQLADAGRQAVAALDRLRAEAVSRIRAGAAEAKRLLAERTRQAKDATAAAGRAADHELAAGGTAAVTSLASAPGRGRGAARVRQFGDTVGQQLEATAVAGTAGLDGVRQAGGQQLSQLATGFDNTLAQGASAVDEQMSTISANVSGAATQTTSSVVSSADQVLSDLTSAHNQAVGDFGSGLTNRVGEATQKWSSERENQVSSLRGEVDNQLGGHRDAAQRAPGQLAQVASTAIEQTHESTWDKIGRGIWTAIKKFGEGLLVLLIVTLVVFAVLLIAGIVVFSLEGFLVALAVAGLILLAVSVVVGFMDRWEQYRKKFGDQPWWVDALSAVGIAVLSVGGAFGVTQLLEGAFGYDFTTGDELDPEQRAERVTEGVLTIATLLLFRSVAKKVPIAEGLTPKGRRIVGGLIDVFNRLTGRKKASKGGGPPEPTVVPDAYARLGEKFNLRPDIVQMMRDSKADPVLLDRLLARRLDPERVALTASQHGANGLAVLDALTAQGVPEATAIRLIEEAASLGRLTEIRTLSERGIVRRLLDRGFSTDEIVLLADEVGVSGVATIDGLTGQGVAKPVAIDAARIASRIGAAADVEQLSRPGALENPAGLRNFLLEVEAELRAGLQGKRTTLRDAAQRSTGGQVALEQSSAAKTDSGGNSGADIIDHGRHEAVQQKVVTGKSRPDAVNPVTTNLEKAASQLRGESGETPPKGYTRIADVRLVEPDNAMFPLDRAALLDALKADGVNQTTLRGVDQVRITNGTGTHVYAPTEF